jgi:hypothetical protein
MKPVLSLLFVPVLCVAADVAADARAAADRAVGMPAEFAADALLRIADLESLDKASRIRLLEDAFRLAASAQQPLRKRPATFRFDGISGFLEKTYAQELDGMTLEMRAIEGLLELAPARARALFTELPLLKLPKLSCKDPLTYDVWRFYSVLGKIVASTFSQKEVKDEEPFKLLLRYASVTSPAQIGPMAETIANAWLTDAQFRALVATFAASLKTLGGDDRSFTAARPHGIQIRQLRDAIRKRDGNAIPLLEGYRAYLARHLSGPRCADSTRMTVRLSLDSIPTAIPETQMAAEAGPYFNDSIRVDPVAKLTDAEMTPSKTEGEAEELKGCSSPECKAIGDQYRGLIMREPGVAYASEERQKPEWLTRLRDFLSAMAEWKEDTGATAAEHFRYKVMVYSEVLAVAPAGPGRDAVLQATHDYLRATRLEVENRLEWFLPVNVLLGRVLLDPLGLGKLADQLRNSGDALISLYAELDRIAPRTPDRVVPLF